MDVRQAVDEYAIANLNRNLTGRTREWYDQKLEVFCSRCGQEHLSLEQIKLAEVRRFTQYVTTFINPKPHKPISSYTIKELYSSN